MVDPMGRMGDAGLRHVLRPHGVRVLLAVVYAVFEVRSYDLPDAGPHICADDRSGTAIGNHPEGGLSRLRI